MAEYAVTIRGLAEQIVYVEADSKLAAREKARARDFHDAQEIDFVLGYLGDNHAAPRWRHYKLTDQGREALAQEGK